MKTGNKYLLNPKRNHQYYSKSDGHFMSYENSLKADTIIDRIKWVKEELLEIGSRSHVDVGCKDGYLGLVLAQLGIGYIGVDPSADAIAEAQTKAARWMVKVPSMSVPNYKVSMLENLVDSAADSVSMMEVLEHVVDEKAALKKLCSLAPQVLITTPDIDGRHGLEDSKTNLEHVRLYSQKELEDLCTQYGNIETSLKRDDALYIRFTVK